MFPSFEKDYFGKEVEWKGKHEEQFVVIEPQEKKKEIMGEKKVRRYKHGDVGCESDCDRRGGDRDDRRTGQERGG